MECYASCPASFESALANELRDLGIRRVRPLKGRVSFEGDTRDAYRACLWSRLASRIYLVVGRFPCATDDDLYSGVYELTWASILKPGASIAISAHGVNDALRNTRYATLRVKDAIVDRMQADTVTRPSVDTNAPDARLSLTIRGDRASLALDLSGEPLFKRIPRAVLAHAPADVDILRPDYAALALAESGWRELCQTPMAHAAEKPARHGDANQNEDAAAAPAEKPAPHGNQAASRQLPYLVDFACGEGGILLEAAGMLARKAPGAARTRWGFQGWAGHDPKLWRELLAEARSLARPSADLARHIIATDVDPRAQAAAKRLAAAAGLADVITFVDPQAEALAGQLPKRLARTSQHRAVILGDITPVSEQTEQEALRLAAELRRSPNLAGARAACLTREGAQLYELGKPSASLRLTLGSDNFALTLFDPAGSLSSASPSAPAKSAATVDVGEGKPVPLIIPESEQFAHRLIKVARLRRRWAKREGVSCYRVYDADLPDYSAAIDLYEGSAATPGRWLVIAEYAAPRTIDPERARDRMLDLVAIAQRVLNVPPQNVFVKTRQRSRGGSQYGLQVTAAGASPASPVVGGSAPILIEEGGLTFAVEFGTRLDTGIFLDHRLVRSLVREHARGAHTFLNLFAYTGTATCYAADGGAEQTWTVDLSNTYLDWAEENMRLNGFAGREHRFVRADVLAWVEEQERRGTQRWDLIFCDPPTFSNSTSMGERTWDVQRDHVELLRGITNLLAPGGEAIFSCNLRGFKPDVEALERADVQIADITEESIPEDFARNKRIHHCYIVRKA